MQTQFKIGDRVRYSSTFCRLTGAATGITPQRRGTITGFWGSASYPLAHILWDDAPAKDGVEHNGGAAVFNLQRLAGGRWLPRTLN